MKQIAKAFTDNALRLRFVAVFPVRKGCVLVAVVFNKVIYYPFRKNSNAFFRVCYSFQPKVIYQTEANRVACKSFSNYSHYHHFCSDTILTPI